MSFFKKIYPPLQQALEAQSWTAATPLQQYAMPLLKSGQSAWVVDPVGEGKSCLMQCLLVQQLRQAEGEGTRALVLLPDGAAVQAWREALVAYALYTNLRIYAVHDKSDIDTVKNELSLGNDILLGTPDIISRLLSGAGFNVNTLRFWIIDDLDQLIALRQEALINRLAITIEKGQRIWVSDTPDERCMAVAYRLLPEDFPIITTQYETDDDDDNDI